MKQWEMAKLYGNDDRVRFFIGDVRDNLLFSNAEATEAELWNACNQANASEFIIQLSEQIETIIGDRGVLLSGGQCQRLALARALIRKPDLLILDEATSALDTNSERLIQEAIDNIGSETTIVVVAHRLSTIVNADYVYVMHEGKIKEEGSYSDLLTYRGLFYKMVQTQQFTVSV
jgi:ABC-type multidrug transport system fused ATPase/permease subunit